MTNIALGEKRGAGIYRPFLCLLLAIALLLYMTIHGQVTVWWAMLIAYGLGAAVYYWERRHRIDGENSSLFGYLFPKKIWLHQSSLNDGFVGMILYAAFILPTAHFHSISVARNLVNALFPQTVPDKTVLAPTYIMNSFSSIPHEVFMRAIPQPGTAVIILYSIAAVIVVELFYYFAHRLSHTVPMLWEFHKIHHSAEVMTPLTVQRFHPLDAWFTFLVREAGLVLVSCPFLYFYPGIKGVYVVAGVNLGLLAANYTGSNLRHSHIWLRFGKPVEHVLVSPALHQVHHSIEKRHLNKNYGSFLSLWDWVFGSLYIPEGRENITFGLGSSPEAHAPYQTMAGLLFHPFRQFFRKSSVIRSV